MDRCRSTRRSASHDALSRSFAADVFPPPPTNRHHVPRRFNEDSSGLKTPGPVESMLRTTTETGNVALFPSKPDKPHAASRGPLRPRPSLANMSCSSRPGSRTAKISGVKDDRRHLPSYQESTCEIISMYAPNSSRSAASSSTSPSDDTGQRCYSMTACSSSDPPGHQPSCTLQAHRGHGLLQRPQSPFPYPARLRRPGWQRSSPALRENGHANYNETVAMEQAFCRTAPTPYQRQPYAPPSRRALPRLERLEKSTRLPDSISSYGVSDGYRIPADSAPAVWASRGGWRKRRFVSGASEDSRGTPSLSSIVDMYHPSTRGPASRKSSLSVQPVGAFYYDYSEDFDHGSEIPPCSTPNESLAPISTRSVSSSRPAVLQVDEQDDLVFQGPEEYDLAELLRRLPADDAPCLSPSGTSSSLEGFLLHLPKVEDFQTALDTGNTAHRQSRSQSGPRAPCSPSHREGVSRSKSNWHARMGSRGTLSGHNREFHVSQPYFDTSSPARRVACPGRSNEPSSDEDSTHWLSPGGNRMTSHRSYQETMRHVPRSPVTVFTHCRKTSQLSPALNTRETLATASPLRYVSCRDYSPVGPEPSILNPMEISSRTGNSDNIMEFGRHQAHLAIPQIPNRHPAQKLPDELISAAERSQTPMLAPQPISPVRTLKLQDSVPQIMKSLDPLPQGLTGAGCSRRNSFVEEYKLFAPLYPDDTPLGRSRKASMERFGPNSYPPEDATGRLEKTEEPGEGRNQHGHAKDFHGGPEQSPRLKLQTASNFDKVINKESLFSEIEKMVQIRTSESSPSGLRNGSLNIQVSMDVSTKPAVESKEACSSPVEVQNGLATQGSTKPLVAVPLASTGSNLHQGEESAMAPNPRRTEETGALEDVSIDSPAPSIPTPGPALPSRRLRNQCSEKNLMPTEKILLSPSSLTLRETGSSPSKGGSARNRRPRGLKKRLPDLRVRLAESRVRGDESLTLLNNGRKTDEGRGRTGNKAVAEMAANNGKAVLGDRDAMSTDELNGTGHGQPRGFRSRMSKWIKTVRRTIIGGCTDSR